MKSSITINIKILVSLFFIISITFYNNNILGSENIIIFKINKVAYTSIDLEKRIEYLDFVGSNNNLDRQIIIDDFISANLFFEYYKSTKNKFIDKDRINQIYENILNTNTKNNKTYNYKIDKKNILMNIQIDYIRKSVLENILNKNFENFNTSKEEIDLLYNLNIKYISFSSEKKSNIKNIINDLNDINFKNVKKLLDDKKINYLLKEKEINDTENIDKLIKENILTNKKYFFIEKNENISIFFITKSFSTLDGVTVNLYSIRSKEKISSDLLLCKNLKKINNANIINKEYNLIDLNNKLKNNLIDINDYVKYINNNENVYIVLCDIKFDKEKLKNLDFNKQINSNVGEIEKKFINKYGKIFNLIKYNA